MPSKDVLAPDNVETCLLEGSLTTTCATRRLLCGAPLLTGLERTAHTLTAGRLQKCSTAWYTWLPSLDLDLHIIVFSR